ncbi:MAG TPA: YbaB/EbfC family nucleoid-associated protein [Armatimonadetes bacterium]|nr:YbaB/EbfC family nucleoid-associated protein [Armatimonadota bacterium]
MKLGGGWGKMMKQLRKVQEDVLRVQEELEGERVEATAGGGAVKAVATGTGELLEVKIDPEAVDLEDLEMLEDMIVAAVREVMEQAQNRYTERMQRVAGDLGLPPGLL